MLIKRRIMKKKELSLREEILQVINDVTAGMPKSDEEFTDRICKLVAIVVSDQIRNHWYSIEQDAKEMAVRHGKSEFHFPEYISDIVFGLINPLN